MDELVIVGIALTLVIGIGAQWLAWKLRWPAILLLLLFGLIAGPGLTMAGYQGLNPRSMFGDALIPMVSLAVAVILFEGGLTLKFKEIKKVAGVVVALSTIGALVTWGLAWLAAQYILGLPVGIAALIGAILTVTGPTVIVPLLRSLRAKPKLGSILKWEGIVIDPIGAMLAVVVFEAVISGHAIQEAGGEALMNIFKTVGIGSLIGLAAAAIQVFIIKRFWVPDFLQNAVVLMFVIGAHTLANYWQHESGLFAVTVMGVALANQKWVSVKSITEFKETLRVIFISSVFIILAASISVEDLQGVVTDGRAYLFLFVLIAFIRPATVFASTMGRSLQWKEKLFLAAVAPRGIVAAAVSSVFALRLMEEGVEGADRIGPIVFFVILGTVAVYGTLSVPAARKLQVTSPKAKGVLLVGAHSWSLQIAHALRTMGFAPMVVDNNIVKIEQAQREGFEAHQGSVFDDNLQEEMVLAGIGWMMAMTGNDGVNTLAAKEMTHLLDSAHIYQLQPADVPEKMAGRVLFNGEQFGSLNSRFARGGKVEVVRLDRAMTPKAVIEAWPEGVLPLFAEHNEELVMMTPDQDVKLDAGDYVTAMIQPNCVRPLEGETVDQESSEEVSGDQPS
jgi:NhaP-type Na+/H+ or K+/H+ antiporter